MPYLIRLIIRRVKTGKWILTKSELEEYKKQGLKQLESVDKLQDDYPVFMDDAMKKSIEIIVSSIFGFYTCNVSYNVFCLSITKIICICKLLIAKSYFLVYDICSVYFVISTEA